MLNDLILWLCVNRQVHYMYLCIIDFNANTSSSFDQYTVVFYCFKLYAIFYQEANSSTTSYCLLEVSPYSFISSNLYPLLLFQMSLDYGHNVWLVLLNKLYHLSFLRLDPIDVDMYYFHFIGVYGSYLSPCYLHVVFQSSLSKFFSFFPYVSPTCWVFFYTVYVFSFFSSSYCVYL